MFDSSSEQLNTHCQAMLGADRASTSRNLPIRAPRSLHTILPTWPSGDASCVLPCGDFISMFPGTSWHWVRMWRDNQCRNTSLWSFITKAQLPVLCFQARSHHPGASGREARENVNRQPGDWKRTVRWKPDSGPQPRQRHILRADGCSLLRLGGVIFRLISSAFPLNTSSVKFLCARSV